MATRYLDNARLEYKTTASVIQDNTASSRGGGVFQAQGYFRSFVFEPPNLVSVLRNSANDGGGGIALVGDALSLQYVTVRDNIGGRGGGVYVLGTGITVSRVELSYNAATLGDGEGGGMYLDTASAVTLFAAPLEHVRRAAECPWSLFSLTRCLQNLARVGGGAFVRASTLVQGGGGTYIVYNRASRYGGGVHVQDGGDLQAFNLTGNAALGAVVVGGAHAATDFGDGGAVSAFGGSVRISDSWVADNSAARRGGAIYSVGAVVTADGFVHVMNCAASDGGGLFLGDGSTFDGAAVADVTDTTASRGGAIFMSGSTSINSVVVRATTADIGGGLVCSDGECAVVSVDLTGTSATLLGGHAAVLPRAVLRISNVIMLTASATDGGSVFMDSGSELHATDAVVSTTTATDRGGAIYCRGCAAVVGPLTIQDTGARSGGGVFMTAYDRGEGSKGVVDSSAVLLDDVHVEDVDLRRTTSSGDGGSWLLETVTVPDNDPVAVWRAAQRRLELIPATHNFKPTRSLGVMDVCMPLTFDLEDVNAVQALAAEAGVSTSSLRLAVTAGDVAECVPPRITMRNVDIEFGSALAGVGGGMAVYNATILHRKVVISRCNATVGGAMFVNQSRLLGISANTWSTISESTARASSWNSGVAVTNGLPSIRADIVGGGGGVFSTGDSQLSRWTIAGNLAARGAGLAVVDGSLALQDMSLATNLADELGGGIYGVKVALSSTDVLVSHNGADEEGGGTWFNDVEGTSTRMLVTSNNAPVGAGMFTATTHLAGEDNEVTGNPRWEGHTTRGGGIYVAPGNCSFAGFSVRRCSAVQAGGGAYFANGALCTISSSMFVRNRVTSDGGIGAGLAAELGTSMDITDSAFTQNACDGQGSTV